MASRSLDHSLSLSPSQPITPREMYQATVLHITECVCELKSDFTDGVNPGFPITDDAQVLQRLCAKLELLLRSGLKPKVGILGRKKDYWDYYCDCLASNKSLNDGIKFVKSLNELKTSLGRGRAFIRFTLVHQRLADTIQQCTLNSKVTNDWYQANAVWFNKNLSADLISALYDLNDIQFDLQPRGYDLDTSWPTFARKTFGSPAQSWRPPSRSTSISSLSSIPTLEVYAGSLPLSEEIQTVELERVKEELTSAEREKEKMSEEIETLENEKVACDGESDQLKKRVEELEAELKSEKTQRTKDLKQLDKLQEELQRKEVKWIEKEKFINDKVDASDQQVGSLNSTLTSMREVLEQNMDMTELKVKVTTQQKQLLALDMDLRGAKIELDQKLQVDEKKNKLIELLDKRLEQSKEEITRDSLKKNKLINMVDGMIRDKEKQTKKLIEATAQITELCRLNDTRVKENNALKTANAEMKKMLDSLRFKGSEIAKLAKEKVLKYKDESENLQKELDTLKEGLPAGSCEQLEEMQEDLKEVATKVEAREEQESQLSELQLKLNATLEGVDDQSEIGELLTALQNSEKINVEIKEMMQEMKGDRTEMQKERERMEAKVQQLKQENEELQKVGQGGGAAKAEELTEALTTKEKEVEQLKLELTTIKTTIGQLLGAGIGAGGQVAVDDFSSQLDQLEQLILGADSVDGVSLKELQTQLQDTQARVKEKDEMIQSMDRERKMMLENVDEMKEDIEMLKDSHKVVMEDKNKMAANLEEKQRTFEEMNSEEGEGSKAEVEEVEEVERSREEVEEVEGLQKRLTESEAELNEIKMKLQEVKFMETACQEMSGDKTQLESEITTLKSEMEILKSELEAKSEEIEVLSEELKSKLDEKEVDLQTENVTLRERLLCFLEGKDMMFRKLLTEKEAFRDQIENLNQVCEAKTIAHDEMAAKVIDLEKNIGTLKEEIIGDKNKVELLSLTIKEREDGIEEMRKSMEEEKKRGEDAVVQLKLDLDGMEAAVVHRERLWENARENMETEISSLKFQLSSAEIQHDTKLKSVEEQHMSRLEQQSLDQDGLIENLSLEVRQLRAVQDSDSDRHVCEVAQLRSSLNERDGVIEALKDDKQELQVEMQTLNHTSEVLKAQITELNETLVKEKEQFEAEMAELDQENTELKKKLIQLIKDKDSLWQKTDRLEFEQRIQATKVWMDNASVTHCMDCAQEFSLILRKHHCRQCGKIFCHMCSNNFVMTASSSRKERVCNACLMNNSSLESVAGQSRDSDNISSEHSELEASVQLPVMMSKKWDKVESSCESSPAGSTHDIATTVQDEEDSAPVTQHIEADEEEEVAEQPVARGTMSAVTQATFGVTKAMMDVAKAAVTKAAAYTPGLPGRSSEEPRRTVLLTDDDKAATCTARTTTTSNDSDETFDFVTQEEISTSMMDTLPDPNMISSLLLTSGDLLDQGQVDSEPELWIRAGKSFAVPIMVEQSGLTLKWQFSTQPKGIHFSVVYSELDFVPITACEVLIPTTSCNSHKEDIEGELVVHKAGVYTLIFDNTTSRFTAKKLLYKLYTVDQEEREELQVT